MPGTKRGGDTLCRLAIFVVALSAITRADVLTIPNSGLTPSNSLYTSSFGNAVVMTGGGNAPGVGDPAGRNDDGFSGPIDLGYTLNFFGTNYSQFWINNNGNISFTGGIAAYTPNGPQGAPEPIISPFFADVDTRNPSSGVVYLNNSIPNETIVTWDAVGYFDANANKLDTFQLVLRGPGFSVPSGEGQIGFFYTTMQWETGDASGGSGGFGGTPAAVGFGDGAGNGEILQGSIQNGISSVVNDTHIWFNLTSGGVPVTTTPEPATWVLMLVPVSALLIVARTRIRVS